MGLYFWGEGTYGNTFVLVLWWAYTQEAYILVFGVGGLGLYSKFYDIDPLSLHVTF